MPNLLALGWLSLFSLFPLGCRTEPKAAAKHRPVASASGQTAPEPASSLARDVRVAGPCRDTILCDSFGRCTYQAQPGGKFTCLAQDDTDCENAQEACKEYGECSARNGHCVASSDAVCAASPACKLGGLCSAIGDWCQARDAKDCEVVAACRKKGACALKKIEQGSIGMYIVDDFDLYTKENLLAAPSAFRSISGSPQMWGDETPDARLHRRSALDPALFVFAVPQNHEKIQVCRDVKHDGAEP